jgi:hypothetical protein
MVLALVSFYCGKNYKNSYQLSASRERPGANRHERAGSHEPRTASREPRTASYAAFLSLLDGMVEAASGHARTWWTTWQLSHQMAAE